MCTTWLRPDHQAFIDVLSQVDAKKAPGRHSTNASTRRKVFEDHSYTDPTDMIWYDMMSVIDNIDIR